MALASLHMNEMSSEPLWGGSPIDLALLPSTFPGEHRQNRYRRHDRYTLTFLSKTDEKSSLDDAASSQ